MAFPPAQRTAIFGDPMLYRQLGKTGLAVSVLSFGAPSLVEVFGEIDKTEGMRTVCATLDLGINFIDVSLHYAAAR